MLKGRSINELARELERQEKSKADYIADSRATELFLAEDETSTVNAVVRPRIRVAGLEETFNIGEIAHQQIAERLKIYKPYYDRMLATNPELLTANVNSWFKLEPARRMLRTLDGRVRGILSDRFRPLDCFDLCEATLPTLAAMGVEIRSAELTERKMYIQAVLPKLQGEVQVGDIVQAGVCITNSEVGLGAVNLEFFAERLRCMNGMVGLSSLRRYHIGRGNEEDGDVESLYSLRTKNMSDAAFWNQVRDVVKGSFTQEGFDKGLAVLKVAAETKMPDTADPVKVVERVQRRFGLNDTERGTVLKSLIQGGDLSKWGLANAITAVGHTVSSYDRCYDMERFGGMVVELPKSDWEALTN